MPFAITVAKLCCAFLTAIATAIAAALHKGAAAAARARLPELKAIVDLVELNELYKIHYCIQLQVALPFCSNNSSCCKLCCFLQPLQQPLLLHCTTVQLLQQEPLLLPELKAIVDLVELNELYKIHYCFQLQELCSLQ